MEKRMQVASVQWFIGNKMHLKFSDRIQYNGNQRLLDAIEPTFLTRMKSKTHLDGSEESICLSDCETHSRVTDIWCLPSMWNSLARLGSDCLNKSPHFLSAWSIIVPTVCTNWFLCFPFLLWLRRLGLETVDWLHSRGGRVGHWTQSWHVIWHLHVMRDILSWYFMTCNLMIGFTSWPSWMRSLKYFC